MKKTVLTTLILLSCLLFSACDPSSGPTSSDLEDLYPGATIDPNAPSADASLPAITPEVMDALIGYGGNIRFDIPEGSKLMSSQESTFIYENFDLKGEVVTGNLDVISTSSYFEDATETLNGKLGSYVFEDALFINDIEQSKYLFISGTVSKSGVQISDKEELNSLAHILLESNVQQNLKNQSQLFDVYIDNTNYYRNDETKDYLGTISLDYYLWALSDDGITMKGYISYIGTLHQSNGEDVTITFLADMEMAYGSTAIIGCDIKYISLNGTYYSTDSLTKEERYDLITNLNAIN